MSADLNFAAPREFVCGQPIGGALNFTLVAAWPPTEHEQGVVLAHRRAPYEGGLRGFEEWVTWLVSPQGDTHTGIYHCKLHNAAACFAERVGRQRGDAGV